MINAPFNDGDNKNNTFRYWSPDAMIKHFDYFADLGIKNVKINIKHITKNPIQCKVCAVFFIKLSF